MASKSLPSQKTDTNTSARNIRYLIHCGATLEETRAPLFVTEKLHGPVDTTYPPSHSNILPTIFDLMNYPQDARPHELNLSLLKAKGINASDRFFFVGNSEKIMNYEVLEKNTK